jgi:hypothetical protein
MTYLNNIEIKYEKRIKKRFIFLFFFEIKFFISFVNIKLTYEIFCFFTAILNMITLCVPSFCLCVMNIEYNSHILVISLYALMIGIVELLSNSLWGVEFFFFSSCQTDYIVLCDWQREYTATTITTTKSHSSYSPPPSPAFSLLSANVLDDGGVKNANVN